MTSPRAAQPPAIRPIVERDCDMLRQLAAACPPLDVHTPYTYWVIARYFGDLGAIAEIDGRPVGFATAILRARTALFWQIGVLPEWRGQRISRPLIDQVWSALTARGATECELSIAPDNASSHRAFASWAARRGLSFLRTGQVMLLDDGPAEPAAPEIRYTISG